MQIEHNLSRLIQIEADYFRTDKCLKKWTFQMLCTCYSTPVHLHSYYPVSYLIRYLSLTLAISRAVEEKKRPAPMQKQGSAIDLGLGPPLEQDQIKNYKHMQQVS